MFFFGLREALRRAHRHRRLWGSILGFPYAREPFTRAFGAFTHCLRSVHLLARFAHAFLVSDGQEVVEEYDKAQRIRIIVLWRAKTQKEGGCEEDIKFEHAKGLKCTISSIRRAFEAHENTIHTCQQCH